MLARQERAQFVIGLYNQGKTIREIARELRMSFRDIGAVLKKEEKEKERQMKQLDKNTSSTDGDSSQRGLSLSAQAYELFSQGKTPIQVAIELNLRESQATRYYREYWKLKGLYKLNLVYEEIRDGIIHFLKLHRLSKTEGMSTEHVVNLLKIANNDLPALENRYKKIQSNVEHLESRELDLSINLEDLKSQKEASKMLQLHRQNMRLGRLLTGFTHNNKDYIKIQFVARQTVKSALSDNRQLLKLALHSLIESWRADPTKFNSLIHGMSPVSTISKSTIINYAGSGNYHATPFSSYYNQSSYTENLMEIIVNGAASFYEKMVKNFTNETITNAALCSSAMLLPPMIYLDEQTDHTQASLAYRHITKTPVYD